MNEIYNIISYIIPITIEQNMYLFTGYGDESMFLSPETVTISRGEQLLSRGTKKKTFRRVSKYVFYYTVENFNCWRCRIS